MKTKKDLENTMLTTLNDFMKKYGIEEITFGKSHSVVKTKGKKAKDVINEKNKGKTCRDR